MTKSISRIFLLAGISLLCSIGTPSVASTVLAAHADSVVAALKENGYQAKLEKGDDGSPQIITASGGNKMVMTFSSCTKGDNCEYIELIASWSGTSDADARSAVTKWNGEEHFAAAIYLPKDKYVVLYHYIITGSAGISDSSLIASIEYFDREYVQIGNGLTPAK
ncbi:YbjN domain-containing protein [Phenylobacterium sp.]|uniref:YbjN domain-containing protein n=1 Tax=Phenylobacterium sp. TaxID=1871053 RepID=UPI002BCED749|nr:YbjN domain-containing protein [Phenylobacterium sp.]HLZ76658.1 YbjN domain-containing protein [Phenylobacterium sp.]